MLCAVCTLSVVANEIGLVESYGGRAIHAMHGRSLVVVFHIGAMIPFGDATYKIVPCNDVPGRRYSRRYSRRR